MAEMNDAIAAVATAAGEAGVGIVRVSGENAIKLCSKFFSSLLKNKVREMVYGNWCVDGVVLDEVLCVRFESPASYTGEEMVEVHAHGGTLNLQAILYSLLNAGARLARPGEFTQRAFINGKLDLTQAEAVADLISAKAELGRQAAAQQLKGALFRQIEDWRLRVMDLSAQSEAAVDFPDEEDQIAPRQEQLANVNLLLNEIKVLLDRAHTGRVLRDGFKIAIVGKPNTGKSSLMNCLLGTKRAIVTRVKGTTRDFIEEIIQIKGFPVVLVDTAGIRKSKDQVEAEGIRRSVDQMKKADFRLLVLDRSQALDQEDEELLKQVPQPRQLLANKSDLSAAWTSAANESFREISCKNKKGISKLLESILKSVAGNYLDHGVQEILLSRQRHADALKKTHKALRHVRETLLSNNLGPEFVAGDLRSALDSLGEIVGKTTREEVLNLIFSKFCIGK